jgi:hypothetical protein
MRVVTMKPPSSHSIATRSHQSAAQKYGGGEGGVETFLSRARPDRSFGEESFPSLYDLDTLSPTR